MVFRSVCEKSKMKQHFFCLMALLILLGTSCQHNALTNKLKENYEHTLPLDAALEDIDFFFTTVEQVHLNHLANISTEKYEVLKLRCRAALEEENQLHNEISKSFLTLMAAKTAATFGDGHTYCSPKFDHINVSDQSLVMPPFRMEWKAGHICINDTIDKLKELQGAHLLKINDTQIEEFLEPILTKISGGRKAYRISRFLGRQQIYWALLQPVPQDQMQITISRGMEEPHTVTTNLISLSRYRETFGHESGDPEPSRYLFYHGDRTCYWRYNSFNYSEAGRKHIDAVFSDIHEKKAENLIIDLRFNGGGNSMAGHYILNYITSKPYCMYSGTDVKISRQIPHKEQFGIFSIFLRGRVIKYRNKRKRIKPKDMGYRSPGRIYALIGPATFSSACDLAAVVKDFDIGFHISAPTPLSRSRVTTSEARFPTSQ